MSSSVKSRGSSKSKKSQKTTKSVKSCKPNHSSKSLVDKRVKPHCVNKTNSEMYLVVEASATPAVKKPPKVVISKGKQVVRQSDEELPLVEKLLAEIVSKYKSGQIKDSAYLARLEKKQMVKEIRLLSKALIKSEQNLQKANEKAKVQVKRCKGDRLEADFRLQNSLRRQQKLEAENAALAKQLKDLEDTICEN